MSVSNNVSIAAVLPGGGSGERMMTPTPKQFIEILGKPVLAYTISTFEKMDWISRIVVVVPPAYVNFTEKLITQEGYTKAKIAVGGRTRHESIYNGIQSLGIDSDPPDIVVVHDAVRPVFTEALTKEVASAAIMYGAAGVVCPLISTVVRPDNEGFLESTLDRPKHRASEMPQAFRYNLICSCYDKCSENDLKYGTECLHLVLKYGNVKPKLVESEMNLWKITYSKDLLLFEQILRESDKNGIIATKL